MIPAGSSPSRLTDFPARAAGSRRADGRMGERVNGGPRQWPPAHPGGRWRTVTVDPGQTLSTLSERGAADPESGLRGDAADRRHGRQQIEAWARATASTPGRGSYWQHCGRPTGLPTPDTATGRRSQDTLSLCPNPVLAGVRDGIAQCLWAGHEGGPARHYRRHLTCPGPAGHQDHGLLRAHHVFRRGTANVLIDGAVVGSINSAAPKGGRTVSYTVAAGAHTVQIKGHLGIG